MNAFDQSRLNSFYPIKVARRPFVFQLREATWQRYITVAQRLLCYVFRVAWLKTIPTLHFALTLDQTDRLGKLVEVTTRYNSYTVTARDDTDKSTTEAKDDADDDLTAAK